MSTRPENLTALGSASYRGYILSKLWSNEGDTPHWRTDRAFIWGEFSLDADFNDGTIDGSVN